MSFKLDKDDQGRGWELKYAIYINDKEMSQDEAVEYVNKFMRKKFKAKEIVDWDGPL